MTTSSVVKARKKLTLVRNENGNLSATVKAEISSTL